MLFSQNCQKPLSSLDLYFTPSPALPRFAFVPTILEAVFRFQFTLLAFEGVAYHSEMMNSLPLKSEC